MQRLILTVVLVGFLILTGFALVHHGYWGIISPHFQTFAGAQVFIDLVIALSLFLVWMWRDAEQANRNPYPWMAFILATGSIGALVYLIVYKTRQTDQGHQQKPIVNH